jgi:FKBP-type peptidyl-prolyl cis-trans isomerase SlyD
MQIAKHKVVTLNYTLTSDDGQVLDSSKGRDPLAYIHGTGSLIRGLEDALEGQERGAMLQVKVAPEQGYGRRDEALVHSVPRATLKEMDVQVGMRFQAQIDGNDHILTVVDVQPDTVTVDGNHPLAGVPLNFDVAIVDVRDATPDELSHGHAHGPHGH